MEVGMAGRGPFVLVVKTLRTFSQFLYAVLGMALSARCYLTIVWAHNVQWDLVDLPINFPIHIELVDIVVVALGFLLVAAPSLATVETVICLKACLTQRQALGRILCKISELKELGHTLLVALSTLLCLAETVAMFLFVRELWVSHLCILIQVLHFFPSIAVFLQTLTNGLSSFVTPVLADPGVVRPFARVDHNRAAWAHLKSNGLLILYAILNIIVIFWCHQEQKVYLVFIIPGIMGRLILTYGLMFRIPVYPNNCAKDQVNDPALLSSPVRPFVDWYELKMQLLQVVYNLGC